MMRKEDIEFNRNVEKVLKFLKEDSGKRGKNLYSEVRKNNSIIRKVKSGVSKEVNSLLDYHEESPDIVISVDPFIKHHPFLEVTAFVYSDTICFNPLALASFIQHQKLEKDRKKFVKGLLAEEQSHVIIDKKYNTRKLQSELFHKKTFKGRKVPVWYIPDYIYILQGKEEAACMYVANYVSGMKIYDPVETFKKYSRYELTAKDIFTIGGRLGDKYAKLFASQLLREIKSSEDLHEFLNTVDDIKPEDVYTLEEIGKSIGITLDNFQK